MCVYVLTVHVLTIGHILGREIIYVLFFSFFIISEIIIRVSSGLPDKVLTIAYRLGTMTI